MAMVRGDDYKPFEQRVVRGNIDLNTPRCRVLSRLFSGKLCVPHFASQMVRLSMAALSDIH